MAKESTAEVVATAAFVEPPLESVLFVPLTMADVVDIGCFSREACAQLPSEDEIDKRCRSKQARPLIVEGARVLRFMAGEAGQPDQDELQAALVRFVQIDALLSIVGTQAGQDGKSCIGQAQSEKKECQSDCKKSDKKFCGCFWNSFLAKSNCFLDVGVNIP